MIDEVSGKFEKLGLTKYQSSALSAILSEGEATALAVSEKGSIPYTKVYDVLTGLQFLGFIVSSLERPKKYKVTDVGFIVETLIEKQKNSYYEIRKHAKQTMKMLA